MGELVTSCGASGAGSSISRGLRHLRHFELVGLYCTSLQKLQRTTSRVSTLTSVVAIGLVRSARAGLSAVRLSTAILVTFVEVNHNCQVET